MSGLSGTEAGTLRGPADLENEKRSRDAVVKRPCPRDRFQFCNSSLKIAILQPVHSTMDVQEFDNFVFAIHVRGNG